MRRLPILIAALVAMSSCGGSLGYVEFYWDTPPPPPVPSARTLPPQNVSAGAADLAGAVDPNGYATRFYFEWSGQPDLSYSYSTLPQPVGGTESRTVTYPLAGLAANSTYYYRVFAYNDLGGSSIGSIVPFSTPPDNAAWWARSYGGRGNDGLSAIAASGDGGVVAAGFTDDLGTQPGSAWVCMVDGTGVVAWQKAYGGPGRDVAKAVVRTADNGYVVAGTYDTSTTSAVVSSNVWVLRLNADGTVRWQKRYGPGVPNAIRQTADGGFIVVGGTWAAGAGGEDFLALRLDGEGSVRWQRTYGGAADEEAVSVEPSSDNGYVVAGWSGSFGAGGSDVWVLKLNGDGSVAWQKAYGGAAEDRANSFHRTQDGGYAFAGYTVVDGGVDLLFGKIAADGAVQWWNAVGEGAWDEAKDVVQTADGGYVLSGCTRCGTSPIGLAMRWSGDGALQWQKTYGAVRSLEAIREQPDGTFMAAGFTGILSMGSDALLMKFGRDGQLPPLDADASLVSRAISVTVSDTPGVATAMTVAAQDTDVAPSTTYATVLQQAP